MAALQVVDFFELHGYKREVDLFGAPYDWRYSLERVDSFFSDLQKLVEDVHARTGRKVRISLAHCTGMDPTLLQRRRRLFPSYRYRCALRFCD